MENCFPIHFCFCCSSFVSPILLYKTHWDIIYVFSSTSLFLFVSAFYNNKITKLLDEFVNLPQYKDKINNKLLNKLKEVNQLN